MPADAVPIADAVTGEIVERGAGVAVSSSRQRTLDVLREQIAPYANDDELRWLDAVGQRLGLDPIAGHIVLIPRWDSRVGRAVHRPQITADGRLVLADRTGELDGFTGPEWTGPRNEDGSHTWFEVWDGDVPPHAARVFVYRHGRTHPANGTVRWAEFAQRDSKNKLLPTWSQMPSHMLGKVALSLGLRRAFPGILTGDDLDDDFVPLERDPIEASSAPPASPTSSGESPARPPAPESTRSDSSAPGQSERQQPAPADSIEVAVSALDERVAALGPDAARAFEAYREEMRWPWPPTSTAVIAAAARFLDALEAPR